MKKARLPDTFLLFLKIALPILTLIPLVFFSCNLIEGHIDAIANDHESHHDGMGFYIFLSHILLAGMNAVLWGLAGVALLISKKYKSTPKHDKNVVAFDRLTVTPILSQILYVIITVVVLNIG